MSRTLQSMADGRARRWGDRAGALESGIGPEPIPSESGESYEELLDSCRAEVAEIASLCADLSGHPPAPPTGEQERLARALAASLHPSAPDGRPRRRWRRDVREEIAAHVAPATGMAAPADRVALDADTTTAVTGPPTVELLGQALTDHPAFPWSAPPTAAPGRTTPRRGPTDPVGVGIILTRLTFRLLSLGLLAWGCFLLWQYGQQALAFLRR